MSIQKTSVTYIYSNDCDAAKYLEYLIDKVRKTEGIDFNPICIEDYKKSAAAIKKMEDSLETRIKSKDFQMAMDERAKILRHKLANKYSAISPLFILNAETDTELLMAGSKKSLARILDITTRIGEAAQFMQSVDFSGFENVLKQVASTIVSEVQKDKTVEQGLETIADRPQ